MIGLHRPQRYVVAEGAFFLLVWGVKETAQYVVVSKQCGRDK